MASVTYKVYRALLFGFSIENVIFCCLKTHRITGPFCICYWIKTPNPAFPVKRSAPRPPRIMAMVVPGSSTVTEDEAIKRTNGQHTLLRQTNVYVIIYTCVVLYEALSVAAVRLIQCRHGFSNNDRLLTLN